MRNSRKLALCVILIGLTAGYARADLAARFDRLNDVQRFPRATVAAGLKRWLGERHVVFVGGYMGEVIDGYFNDNRAELLENLGGARVSILQPSSFEGFQTNANWLAIRLRELYAQGGRRPLIVVGHSKGGAEVALRAIQSPDLLKSGVVDTWVIVQAALGGSPLAGILFGSDGADDLHPSRAYAIFDEALARLSNADRELLSQSFFTVRGQVRQDIVAPSVAGLWLLLQCHLARDGSSGSDGMLLTGDQRLTGVGQDLGVLDADHADLTISNPLISNSTTEFKRTFTRALFEEIFEALGSW